MVYRKRTSAIQTIASRRLSLWLGFLAPIALWAQAPSNNLLDISKLVPFLNQTINWSRQTSIDQQIATDPNDQMMVSDNRQLAGQVVRLSFDFARLEADAISKATPPTQQGAHLSQQQQLLNAQNRLNQQVQDLQAESDRLKQRLASSTGRQRHLLESQIAETKGEIDLANARKEALRNMLEFTTGANESGGTGLRAQIDALAGSIPAEGAAPTASASTNSGQTTTASTDTLNGPSGIWDLTADLLGIYRNLHTIDAATEQTQALAKASADLRMPLVNRLRELSREGDQLANEPQSKDPNALVQQKSQVDALTTQFKQISSIVLPLSKQAILLDLYARNLATWRATVKSRFGAELVRLLVRLAVLAFCIAIAIGLGELAKRAIYRYVHETRRRYQFLLLRKFVLGFTIVIIVAFAFASRLGSAVTFAGLLTAGVAVALQNVILSLVGYFFLIGKFGIRVGDRVQIGGVTGEVIDVGLVRIHLMELGGSAADTPTGRVVAFSNSIVFQPATGLFKQIPGTNFVWHEVHLTLSPETDFGSVRERVLATVESVLSDYKDEIQRQKREMERNLIPTSEDGFQPKSRIRYTASGPEMVIRFPVDLQHAAEIDERITREVVAALEREPKLKLAGSPAAGIRLETNLAAPGAGG